MRAGATPAACGRSRSNRRRAERCDGKDGCSRRARVASSVPVADVGAVAFAARGTVGAEREDVEGAAFARLAVLVRIAPRIGRQAADVAAAAVALGARQPGGRAQQGVQALVGARVDQVFETVGFRSEEHTSELQSLMRISYAVFCLKKKKIH